MRALRRTVGGLAATALLAGATLLGAPPAAATALPISQCTTGYGAILAVDFGHWGGPVLRACGSTPTTGYALLNQGGWHSTGTQTDGPGFVCRIGYSGYQGGAGFPSQSAQPCYHTPPASASWSYWHADPGQSSWSYSEDGAQNYSPPPGSVDLWTFGSASPRVSPDSVRAHNSSAGSSSSAAAPKSSAPGGGRSTPAGGRTSGGGASAGPTGQGAASRPAGGASGQGATGSAAGGSAGTEAGLNHAGHGSSGPANRTPAGTGAPASTVGAGPNAPAIVNAEPAAAVHHSSGSAVPGLVTAAVALALGAIAVVVGWRRRRVR